MTRVVLDAFAVIAWLEAEAGGAWVASLLHRAGSRTSWVGICAVNLGEVYYRTYRNHGLETAEACHALLLGLPWQVVPASDDLVWAAARLKAQYPISYADAFALACAQQHEAVLVTNDPELVSVEHGTPVLWGTDEAAD